MGDEFATILLNEQTETLEELQKRDLGRVAKM